MNLRHIFLRKLLYQTKGLGTHKNIRKFCSVNNQLDNVEDNQQYSEINT